MLFGMSLGPGDFPLDRFLRHVSYTILVNAKARGRCWHGDIFCNMMPFCFAMGIALPHACI